MIYRRAVRPLLFRSFSGDAERVHEQTLSLISRLGRTPPALAALRALARRHQRPVTVAGLTFPAVVGLAAGMDKDGVGVRAWSALGFGHAELGTVTALPQPGNDRPRLFRLPASRAIVNRMGFNNRGASALAATLRAAGVARGNGAVGMPLGISIGKSRTTPLAQATEDYLTSHRLLAPYADYVAVNVSSPNTPGLRDLQDREQLDELVAALTTEGDVPIFVKIAPDLDEPALEQVLAVCHDRGAAGLIATNTTLARDGVAEADKILAAEAGGLSGAPLTRRARTVVGVLARRTTLPIIGVGGLMSAEDGRAMLDAGASLLQVYTGLVYEGPALVRDLNRLLADNGRDAKGGPGDERST